MKYLLALILTLTAASITYAVENGELIAGHLVKKQTSVTLSKAALDAIEAIRAASNSQLQLRAIAPTGSMSPTFDEEFVVLTEQVDFSKLRRRDVIAVQGENHVPFLHRVAELGYTIRTKGDAYPQFDQVITTRANFTGERAVAAVHTTTGKVVKLTRS
jgi:hypothetical protein